ncbi:MAG TPA: bifunctional precorrin-2 dehydrogenase/sirohydrochlorin ferrochelatase [Methylomirabilota bacterium]|jgi:siroheme synthase-like protein|nr:bifunctional precorrin-2 dehydrogenase/sirohydrochlorin ferrochelatase [Methylomirabilota bacterium]
MAYYPIFLALDGQPCLVVGGGPVAERKVEGLLATGAAVTVVSPTLNPGLDARAREGRIRHLGRAYRSGDLTGYRLAFVATDEAAVNAAVAQDGAAAGVWVNAADDPAHCDFILPSVLRRGELQIAVATGGASPALSRAIREELEAYFTADYAALTDVAADVRRELRARGQAASPAAWQAALGAELRRLGAEAPRPTAPSRMTAWGEWGAGAPAT